MKVNYVKQKIAVLGEGAWGTAIATVLAHNGHEVLLWCYDEKNAQEIARTRINSRYLPGIVLSDSIVPTTDFSLIATCEWIAEAIPTQYLRSVLMQMKSVVTSHHKWIVLSKGFEQNTCAFPGTILTDIFGADARYAVVAGPTYAQELARKQMSAAMVASSSDDVSAQVKSLFQSDYFKLYSTQDVIGVQCAGALKNVIALALGILEGAGYGQNARAFFVTFGFHEIVRIAELLGGHRETLYGLAGFGDLILTSYGGLSKNFAIGKKIGAGSSLDALRQELGVLPEGINTLQSFYSHAQVTGLEIPVIESIYTVVFQKKPISIIFEKLQHCL